MKNILVIFLSLFLFSACQNQNEDWPSYGKDLTNQRFSKLDQININGLPYDDKVVGNNMHKVWSGKVEKRYNPYIEKIPERIRQKYGHIKF